jgi:hypothetical protein
MLWQKSPQYEGMPHEEYLQTEEGQRWLQANRRWSDWMQRGGPRQLAPVAGPPAPKPLPAPAGKPAPTARPLPSLPANWRGTREQAAAMGFGFDIKGRPQYMRNQPPAADKKASMGGSSGGSMPYGTLLREGPIPGGGVPSSGSQDPFVRGNWGQPIGPNPAFGAAMGLEWDGSQWVKKNPNADLERQAAELELRRQQWQFDQMTKDGGGSPQAPDLRKLIEEQRRQMDQDDQMRKVAEMLANEQRGRDVLASGEEWRWDGNKIVPLDDKYRQSQKAAGRKQAAERDNFLIEQENRRSVAGNRRSTADGGSGKRIGPVTGVDERGNRIGPGAAQPIPPQDTGTPYGEWIGIDPAGPRIQDFQDRDGDGVDDRYQSGPGAPSQRRLPAGGGGSSGGSRYSPEDIAYIQAQQRMLQEGRGGVAGYRR